MNRQNSIDLYAFISKICEDRLDEDDGIYKCTRILASDRDDFMVCDFEICPLLND